MKHSLGVALLLAQFSFAATQDCTNKGAILYGVYFANALHGWTSGDSGTILSTTDGGRTWCRQTSGTFDDLPAIRFVDERHGWSVGYNDSTILHTEDGGVNWKPIVTGAHESLDAVSFPDNQHGWIVGRNGTILATTDGGASWKLQKINSAIFGAAWLMSVAFVDAQHGWATGTAIVATSDGGATWVDTQAENNDTANRALLFFRYLNSVYFGDRSNGWIAADGGLILNTTDGGKTWRPNFQRAGSNLHGIYFSDPQHGWAVGDRSTIFSTSDAGNSWKAQSPPTSTPQSASPDLNSVFCSDNKHCWAVGRGEAIIATTDGGLTWQRQR